MFKFLLSRFKDPEPITEEWRQKLASEGIRFQVESVPTAVTYRNYSRPGKSCAWNRRMGYLTAVVLTQRRFIIFENGRKIVNLPFESEYWREVVVALRNENSLKVVASVNAFPSNHTGEVELWLDTPLAQTLLTEINQQCLQGAR